jgi:hypothetical protein
MAIVFSNVEYAQELSLKVNCCDYVELQLMAVLVWWQMYKRSGLHTIMDRINVSVTSIVQLLLLKSGS